MRHLIGNKKISYDVFVSHCELDEDFVHEELNPQLSGTLSHVFQILYSKARLEWPAESWLYPRIISNKWCEFKFQTAHNWFSNEERPMVIPIELGQINRDKLFRSLRLYMGTRLLLRCGERLFWNKLGLEPMKYLWSTINNCTPRWVGYYLFSRPVFNSLKTAGPRQWNNVKEEPSGLP